MNRFYSFMLLAFSVVVATVSFGGAAASEPTPVVATRCDVTGIPEMLRNNSRHDREHAKSVIINRIKACDQQLDDLEKKAPTPTPVPWSNATPAPAPTRPESCRRLSAKDDPYDLYADLSNCISYVSKAQAAAPQVTPLPLIASKPTFYVFAAGGVDPTTSALLIRSMVSRLQALAASSAAQWAIIGRPDWANSSSFSAQCQSDQDTRGAIVLEGAYPNPYTNSYLFFVSNGNRIEANVEVVGCDVLSRGPTGSPFSSYFLPGISGNNYQGVLPLGVYAAAFLLNNNTTSSTTTTNDTTAGTVETKTVTTQNALTPAFAISTLSSSLGSQSVPSVNASGLLSTAAWNFTDHTLEQLNTHCSSDADIKTVANAKIDPALGYATGKDAQNFAADPIRYRAAYAMHVYCDHFNNFAK